jgi:hypothetical protein
MGDGTLSAAIADILSAASPGDALTCDEIAIAAKPKLGFMPSNTAVSRNVGQRTDWRKFIAPGGKTAFRKTATPR